MTFNLKASYDFTSLCIALLPFAVYCPCTEWQRPIRCCKLQVIFRKRTINYRALSRKMIYKDQASCGSSPPCIALCCGYCATWQDSLDWFEVDLSARPASSFRVVRVLLIFMNLFHDFSRCQVKIYMFVTIPQIKHDLTSWEIDALSL